MKCRHCRTELTRTIIDLGCPPPSNAYISDQTLHEAEKRYPLKVLICGSCWLVQTEDFVCENELFSKNYAYFSSFSSSWLRHARNFVVESVKRFKLNETSRVVEIAANDGYLLQYVRDMDVPCYGIEPTGSTAQSAREKGIEIVEEFFGIRLASKLADQNLQGDLVIANNVLAHVPDINDFASGVCILLKTSGVATFEFPHVMKLVMQNQFDTIYHEHYSYLSLTAILAIFTASGLRVFDVEELSTHGGSLRVYACRADTGTHAVSESVIELKEREVKEGIDTFAFYESFQDKARIIKADFLSFLTEAKKRGKKVAAYGAAAKGNTLLNFAGTGSDLISYVADKNPAKQGKYMPGSRIPIAGEEKLKADEPDYVVILPWNLKDEVIGQLNYIRGWGGRFITAIPKLEIL